MKEAVIVAYGRSPVGKSGRGQLKNVHPVNYGIQVLKGTLAKVPELDPSEIDDIVMGCSMPEGATGSNVARQIGIGAGLPVTVPGQTVNRFCSSGLQAISTAANTIKVGEQEIVVAGGVESMTLIGGGGGGHFPYPDYGTVMVNPGIFSAMGTTAENVAEKYGVSRQEQDEFAVASNEKAARAQEEGRFDNGIIPIRIEESIKGEDGKYKTVERIFDKDEGVRPGTTKEILARLRPAFRVNGSVTAGNSSQTSDGTGVVLMMSRQKAEEMGLKPIAVVKEFAVAGVDPAYMGLGPIPAISKLMKITGLTVDDIDLFEINEAFASQAIASVKELGIEMEKVNPNGGAIALGHPLGATGAILSIKLIDELKRQGKKTGVVSMCIGGGQGAAGLIELC